MIALVVLSMTSQTIRTGDPMTLQKKVDDYVIKLTPAQRAATTSIQHQPTIHKKPETKAAVIANKTKEVTNAKALNNDMDEQEPHPPAPTMKSDSRDDMKVDNRPPYLRYEEQDQVDADDDPFDHGLFPHRPDLFEIQKIERLGHGERHIIRLHQAHRRAEILENRQKELEIAMELQSRREEEDDFGYGDETENTNGELRHVFFLKVHKAASTTVMNVLYRFAIKRHLSIMLPIRGNVLSEVNKQWRRRALPPPNGYSKFDILCNHLVFNEETIRTSLSSDAKFIGIVREPFQQFVSAFLYYRTKFRLPYLMKVPGPNSVATYLTNPARYEAKNNAGSYTHNRMSFDFGMEPKMMGNEEHVEKYIAYLNNTFHLVMVSERFDESMVLLKRLLGWRLQDILYIKNNVFIKRGSEFTAEQRDTHKKFNAADYALYDHFSRLFQARVEAEGRLFAEEVSTYVALREKVEDFCTSKDREEEFHVPATSWTPVFVVKRIDCMLMTLPEVPLVNVARRVQYGNGFMPMGRMRFPRYDMGP